VASAFPLIVVIAAIVSLAATGNLLSRSVEEGILRDRFPDYADYARTTRALVPYRF
jgi:protein-S-isoprenylcysteine O-methyltransferase Ste14